MLNLPNDPKELERLLACFNTLKVDPNFMIVREWLEKEQAITDKKLRRAGDDYLLVAGTAQLLERILDVADQSSQLLNDLRNPARR